MATDDEQYAYFLPQGIADDDDEDVRATAASPPVSRQQQQRGSSGSSSLYSQAPAQQQPSYSQQPSASPTNTESTGTYDWKERYVAPHRVSVATDASSTTHQPQLSSPYNRLSVSSSNTSDFLTTQPTSFLRPAAEPFVPQNFSSSATAQSGYSHTQNYDESQQGMAATEFYTPMSASGHQFNQPSYHSFTEQMHRAMSPRQQMDGSSNDSFFASDAHATPVSDIRNGLRVLTHSDNISVASSYTSQPSPTASEATNISSPTFNDFDGNSAYGSSDMPPPGFSFAPDAEEPAERSSAPTKASLPAARRHSAASARVVKSPTAAVANQGRRGSAERRNKQRGSTSAQPAEAQTQQSSLHWAPKSASHTAQQPTRNLAQLVASGQPSTESHNAFATSRKETWPKLPSVKPVAVQSSAEHLKHGQMDSPISPSNRQNRPRSSSHPASQPPPAVTRLLASPPPSTHQPATTAAAASKPRLSFAATIRDKLSSHRQQPPPKAASLATAIASADQLEVQPSTSSDSLDGKQHHRRASQPSIAAASIVLASPPLELPAAEEPVSAPADAGIALMSTVDADAVDEVDVQQAVAQPATVSPPTKRLKHRANSKTSTAAAAEASSKAKATSANLSKSNSRTFAGSSQPSPDTDVSKEDDINELLSKFSTAATASAKKTSRQADVATQVASVVFAFFGFFVLAASTLRSSSRAATKFMMTSTTRSILHTASEYAVQVGGFVFGIVWSILSVSGRIHRRAFMSLKNHQHLAFCVAGMYVEPIICQSLAAYLPVWFASVTWYASLATFFCIDGYRPIVAAARLILPIVMVLQDWRRHQLLFALNGGERIVLGILAGAFRYADYQQPAFLASTAAALPIAVFSGSDTAVQWMLLLFCTLNLSDDGHTDTTAAVNSSTAKKFDGATNADMFDTLDGKDALNAGGSGIESAASVAGMRRRPKGSKR